MQKSIAKDAVGWLTYAIFCFVLVGSLVFDGARVPLGPSYGGKWKFLTHLNMWLQALYWCLTVLAGLSTLRDGQRKGSIHRVVDYLHSTLAFPVGMFVCIMFWMIYAVDRELVYPKVLDKIVPIWLNHVMHTVHIPFLLVDKYLVRHKYPRQLTGMATLLLFAMLYQCWILFLAFQKSIWVYPILEVMNWPYRIVFFVLNWSVFLLLYKVGHLVTNKFWGGSSQDKVKSK